MHVNNFKLATHTDTYPQIGTEMEQWFVQLQTSTRNQKKDSMKSKQLLKSSSSVSCVPYQIPYH